RAVRVALLAGLGLALLTAGVWALLTLGAISSAHALTSAGGTAGPLIEATHLPPLLTAADDHLGSLKYDIECTGQETEVAAACDLEGTVFARTGTAGAFHALPLNLAPGQSGGRYIATQP